MFQERPWGEKRARPTARELAEAAHKELPTLLGPGLKLVFCGINPGLYSAAIGHHFGRPGNRFWPAVFAAGFTPRLFSPYEDRRMLELGYGMTNLVARATAGAAELTAEELREGGKVLAARLARYRPRWVAVMGIGSYRQAFARPKAQLGLQAERIGETRVWVLPSPSGLNAHFTPGALAEEFGRLRREVEGNQSVNQ